MRRPSLSPGRSLLLGAAVATGAAAELPVTGVTFTGDGAIVTRAGTLPAGDEIVDGIPPASAAELTVAIAGIDRPVWRLATGNAVAPTPDAAALTAARHDLAVAEAAIARAQLRRRLADAAVAAPASGEPAALPSARAIEQRLRFATANADAAADEEGAAQLAAEAARHRLAALEAVPADVRPSGRLELPGAGGRMVTIGYRLADAGWSPRYRLEVAGERARLTVLAVARYRGDVAWPTVPIAFSARQASRALLMPGLAVPQLGVVDAVQGFATPRRAPRDVGFIATESAVDPLRSRFATLQAADGSWGEGRWRVVTTALVTLAFQGAGYDHLTPNKYRARVRRALAFLVEQPTADLALPDLSLTATAVGEAYALTGDPEMKPRAEVLLAALRGRLGELPAAIARNATCEGPKAALLATSALKSMVAAGLDAQADLSGLSQLLPLVERGRDRVEARLVSLLMRVYLGQRPAVDLAEAQRWAVAAPEWYAAGRVDLVDTARLVAFMSGGAVWTAVNQPTRDLLIERADAGIVSPHPAGPLAARAMATLGLEIYYRYAPAKAGSVSGPSPAARVAASGWPVRWHADSPLPMRPDTATEITIAVVDVPGRVERSSVPAQDPSVWRRLVARNPLPTALPAGPVDALIDGEPCGSVTAPFAAPNAEWIVPLGRDPSLRVERTAVETSDDGFRSRTLTVRLAYRLTAPAGWTAPVTVREPIPSTVADSVTLEVQGWTPEELRRRQSADPYWSEPLVPGVDRSLRYELRYPASLRPYLEIP